MKAGLDNQQISSYLKDKAAHSAHAIKAQAHTTKEHAKSTVKNYMVAEDSTARLVLHLTPHIKFIR